MSDDKFTIPDERLPAGFAENVETIPDQPAVPRPAATVVLARDGRGGGGLEVLLLRRNRSSGFVPGAWVFPGGRVDEADRDASLVPLTRGLSAEDAADRLAIEPGDRSGIAYYLAAVREAFEETGIFMGSTSGGLAVPCAAVDADVDRARADLLEDRLTLAQLLEDRKWVVDLERVEYLAHWITPLAEPRRYDTRFFLARVSADSRARLDEREMIAEQWLTPDSALGEWADGRLPMVFPTIKTLESLRGFARVRDALEYFSRIEVPSILPRLVRTPTGVGIEIPE